MSVTDLTGTTWVFNDTLTSDNAFGDAYINFTSNNTNFTKFDAMLLMDDHELYYNEIMVYDGGLWTNNAYKTIEITGGTDVTNNYLISWLENNATQQVEPTPSTPTSTGKIGDLPIIKKHFGSLEIIKEVLNGSVIYESSPQEEYNYEFQNGILTINDAPYTINDGILNIGE